MKKDAIIIGGGIAGLAAAYRLHKSHPDLKIALLEADGRLGGKLRTDHRAGFTMEQGPDCFLARKPRGIALCEELGIADRLIGRKPADIRAYVLRHGRLHPVPEGFSGMVPTNMDALHESDLLSSPGAERVAAEATLPADTGTADESIAAFMTRRLGNEAYENLVEPLMSGIYAGQGTQLSLAATFPQLREIERRHGSLLAGLTARTTAVPASDYPPFVSFPNGISELVDELLKHLDDVDIHTNTPVKAVHQTETGWRVDIASDNDPNGTMMETAAVILTTPAYVTADLLADTAPELAEAHRRIEYGSTALVNFTYDEASVPDLPEGYGYVIPQVENRAALACTWSSRKWDHRAPDGKLMVRVYIGRYGEEDVTLYDDDKLVDIATQELADTLGFDAEPEITAVYRWPRGLPQYNMGHTDRLQRIDDELPRYDGLQLAGAAYRGVGIPDCIREGERAAEAVGAFLTE